MTQSNPLFEPFQLGSVSLKNRIVMAPMTRNRALGNIPNALMADYYAQRAGAGLLITEGTAPLPAGIGYARIPGLYSAEHVAGWKKVTSAVHAKGGNIFVQIMHTGRVSQIKNLPAGERVLAPSAIRFEGELWVDPGGNQPVSEPEAMTEAEIEHAIQGYVNAAALALEAGFDGVELHGANGYLIDQFLNAASNQRTDAWGGSVENRIRFALAVAKRTAERIGAGRVGLRVSPYGVFNGMATDEQHEDVMEALAKGLSQLGIAYLHVVDHSAMGTPPVPDSVRVKIRNAFRGNLLLCGGYGADSAARDLNAGKAELFAFGRPFISNPNLVEKLRNPEKGELRPADFPTFYTAGEKGYTDYPAD